VPLTIFGSLPLARCASSRSKARKVSPCGEAGKAAESAPTREPSSLMKLDVPEESNNLQVHRSEGVSLFKRRGKGRSQIGQDGLRTPSRLKLLTRET
jgi:hypothetical protein